MLDMIALKRKEQEDEAVHQLMKAEAKRKLFKEVKHSKFSTGFDFTHLVYGRLCWRKLCEKGLKLPQLMMN